MVDVIATTGLSRSTIYRGIASADFPRPIQFTSRTVRWWGADVVRWLEDRRAASLSA